MLSQKHRDIHEGYSHNAEPSQEVWSKVKMEKTNRSEFRVKLKAKHCEEKEKIESVAFGDGNAKL
jgi:hypothetical protein